MGTRLESIVLREPRSLEPIVLEQHLLLSPNTDDIAFEENEKEENDRHGQEGHDVQPIIMISSPGKRVEGRWGR